MTDPDRTLRLPGARPARWRLAIALTAMPPFVLAASAIAGLGLERGLPWPAAFASGLALTVLPVVGLCAGTRRGAAAAPIASWLWCGLVLVGLPAYFPGERAAATARGLKTATAFTGQSVSSALGAAGARLVSVLGEDAAPRRDGAPSPVPAGHAARAPRTSPTRGPAAGLQAATTAPEAGPGRVVRIPYEGDQTSLRVRVDVDGPVVGERVEMIFDTGATFTTLDHATLDRLGVPVERDAPRITLRTANGPIEAPLVLVDAVWLDDEPIEWVTVAVCDSCVSPPAVGLLGLNVTQRFHVSLDHDRRRIELAPRQRGGNRALDVRQWLSIRSVATRQWTGSIDVSLTASNRSHRPIEHAVVDLSCGGQTVAVQIDAIPARGERATAITLPRGTDCSEQRIEVSRATWVLDRF